MSRERMKVIIEEIEDIKSQFKSVGGDGIPRTRVLDGELFESWRSRVQFELKNLKQDDFTNRILELTKSFDGWSDERVFLELVEKLKILNENYESYHENYPDKRMNSSVFNNKVFVVHGHDEAIKESVARLLERQDIEPIILHEQENCGKTIIEKIERYSDVSAAIILFTPDDIGKSKSEEVEKERARQNVVYEAGYFAGKLGRDRVIIVNGVEEMPSDLSGIAYTSQNDSSWRNKILSELRTIGFTIDKNKL